MGPGKIAIVLVSPRGEANIGAAARAMMNFGVGDLRIVGPFKCPSAEAKRWAAGARPILKSARAFKDLEAALEDAQFALAFTRRPRRATKAPIDVEDLRRWVRGKRRPGRVALVFGREDKGLTNGEVALCDAIVAIPTSEALPALNLAQAVLIACYELAREGGAARRRRAGASAGAKLTGFVPRGEIARITAGLGEALSALGYADAPAEGKVASALRSKILARLGQLFARAGLMHRDVGMLEGLAARVIEACGDGER